MRPSILLFATRKRDCLLIEPVGFVVARAESACFIRSADMLHVVDLLLLKQFDLLAIEVRSSGSLS